MAQRRGKTISGRQPARPTAIALWFAALLLAAACGGPKVIIPPPPATAKKSPPPKPAPEPTPAARPEESTPPTPESRPAQPPATPPTGPTARTVYAPDGAGPVMRIGIIPAATRVAITSEAKFYLAAGIAAEPRTPVTGTITVSLEEPPGPEEKQKIFRVQMASLTRAQDAEALRRLLEKQDIKPVLMQFNPNAAAYRIRVGQYETQAAAAEAAEQLRRRGYAQAMVVPETISRADAPGERRGTLRAAGADVSQRSPSGFRLAPSAPEKYIKVNGKPYRGLIEARRSPGGKLVVINEVAMEEYLKGVVPEELPPGGFPELEGLKAQAIAARTYALKHKGQFQSEGYDLLASDRSQVYGGVASEHPLSTQAVAETAGLALYARGALIDALYTSTCGGRTEDFENIFGGGKPVSYLRGVLCAIDQDSAVANMEIRALGPSRRGARNDEGQDVPPEMALLSRMGILPPRELSHAHLSETPAPAEIKDWIRRTAQVLKRKSAESDGDARLRLERLAYFCVYLVEQIFSRQAARVLLSEADTQYYLAGFRDAREIPSDARPAVAFLVQKNILIPYPDNTLRPLQSLSRRAILGMLYRTLEGLSALPLESGTILRAQDQQLQIKNGRATVEARLASDLGLYQRIGKTLIATDALRVVGGEEIRYHRMDGQIDYLEVKLGAGGAANDRYSRFTQWEVAMTSEEATKKLREVFKLGRLIDLQPVKYGSSQRVTELKVIGSQGEFSLRALRIRSVLGLRDTLFTIAREQAEDGTISKFIFTGRGWGHGVGLCQTGAYGMARAGERAETILKKYYTGVEIRKAY